MALSPSPPPSPPLLHHPTFPIIAVALIGILATAFLLLTYYIFVIKCCLNYHRIDLLRRLSLSRHRRRHPTTSYSPPPPSSHGLHPSTINSLPLLTFSLSHHHRHDCAVCLNDFLPGEKLRLIPDCNHIFHIDCIDVWLQNNANCPLCRAAISPNSFLHQNPNNDHVSIEIGTTETTVPIVQKKLGSMDDDWIEMERKKDVQPIRRSFSMDSAGDSQLCQAVREIVERHRREGGREGNGMSPGAGCNKKSFFLFGQGRGNSRTAVQPVFLEP